MTLPLLVMIDPSECASKEEFDILRISNYKYYVIGGNHSVCARTELLRKNPKSDLGRVECWIFAGLSVQECRILAWGHNVDAEFRQQMTLIEKCCYVHTRYEEAGRPQPFTKELTALKKECAMEINLPGWGEKDDLTVLNNNDNLWQLAFRADPVWSSVQKVFDKWEACEVKGQVKEKPKSKAAKPKAQKPTSTPEVPIAGPMYLTEWRWMQGIQDHNVILPVLQDVLDGKYSLSEMGDEFRRQKCQMTIIHSFKKCLRKDTWQECKDEYPMHCTDDIVRSFNTVFQTWVSLLI